jgi:outer membrane protein OmpA-like peptidoglycan-associated protein
MFAIRFIIIIFSLGLLAGCANQGAFGPGLGIQPGLDTAGLSKQELLQKQAVFFDFNKTNIQAKYLLVVQEHAQYLAAHPQQVVLLAGNTDVGGSRAYNLALGEKRSKAVADVLLANGVPSQQIQQVSYGTEVPIGCGSNDDAHALNRRVDILYCLSSTCEQVAKSYAQNICTFPN